MIVQCPHCPARLNIPKLPSPDTPIRCPRCAAVFHVTPPAEEEPAPRPAAPPAAEAEEPVPDPDPVPDTAEPGDEFSWDDSESEPAADRERPTTRRAAPPPKKFPYVLVGGAFLGIAAVVGLVYAFSGGDKPKQTANRPADQPQPQPKKEKGKEKEKEQPEPKKNVPPPQRPKVPEEFSYLFAAGADTAGPSAPTVQVPVLQKVGADDLAIPGFAQKPAVPADGGKLTLEEVKQATAYIKVAAGGASGTGSGFAIRSEGDTLLVATNHHVVNLRTATEPAHVTVVFDGGLPTEWERPGEVVAADPENDLAIIRVTKPPRALKPIYPELATKVTELMDVWICGFPFGAALATGSRSPNVTVGKGTVSSIRLDDAGRVSKIQIDGVLNPGNSGGPVVNTEGRLVGVTVSKVRDSGFGFAVPVPLLTSLLGGRGAPAAVLPVSQDGAGAVFKVLAPVSDALGKLKGVTLHVLTADAPPAVPEAEPADGWKPLAGATKVELTTARQFAAGEFRVEMPAKGAKLPSVVLQLESRGEAGTVFSRPVVHKVALDAVQTAADAIPLDVFRKNIARYAGQVVAVRGRTVPGTPQRGAVYEMFVTDETNVPPDGLVFLADRDLTTQFNELETERQSLPARLTLRVGKPMPDGTTPARVTRIDFIGRNNQLTKSLPSAEQPDDPLIALNRQPDKFVGQELTVLGLLSASVSGSEKEPELSVLFLSQQRPEHLHFTAPPTIATRLNDAKSPDGFYVARLRLRVEDREVDGVGPRVVTVTRVELLGRGGTVFRTIE